MTTKPGDVTREEYIETLFRGCAGTPGLAESYDQNASRPGKEGFDMAFPMRLYNRRARRTIREATHVCGMTLGDQLNENGRPYRTMMNMVESRALIFDDCGSKGNKNLPINVSATMMTTPPMDGKEPSYTKILLLTRPVNAYEYAILMKSLEEYCDPNCIDPIRVNRLPGAHPVDKKAPAELIFWDPTIEYDPDKLLDLVGVARATHARLESGFVLETPPPGIKVDDPVFEWLEANGHVQGEDNGGWYKITCPWHETHSDPRDIAKYRPCGSDSIVRYFKCHHTHGEDHKIQAFLNWVAEQGGPVAEPRWRADGAGERTLESLVEAGVTPREPAPQAEGMTETIQADLDEHEQFERYCAQALDRYVWYEPKGQMFDLWGTASMPLRALSGVKKTWLPFDLVTVGPRGGERRINVITEFWMVHPHKKVTDQLPYIDPRTEPGWNGEFINTYRPFIPNDTTRTPDEFIALVQHVYPEDWRYALDWMASKVQNPWRRQVALVSVSPMFGTGRNSIFNIMRLILGEDNCSHMSASRLFGAEANKFNSHQSKLMITVGEIEEGADTDRRISAGVYNRLKDMVDPNEYSARIERKGADGTDARVFTSYMLATNAGNGLPLEKGERRFSVLGGNRIALKDARPELLEWLNKIRDPDPDVDELSAVHAYLMARDISQFNPDVPVETMAKARMIEEGKGIVDQLCEEATEEFDVFTVNGIMALIEYRPEVAKAPNLRGQIEGWSKRHSAPAPWIKNPDGKMSLDGVKNIRPRVKFSGSGGGEVTGTAEGKDMLRAWLQHSERAGLPGSVVRLDDAKK